MGLLYLLLLVPFVLLATANSAGYRYGASDPSFGVLVTDTTGRSNSDTLVPPIAVRLVSNTITPGSEPAYTLERL